MSEREWRFYIDDMLRFAEKVRTYSAGIDRDAFEHNELKYDAILRNLELIGEAATIEQLKQRGWASAPAKDGSLYYLRPDGSRHRPGRPGRFPYGPMPYGYYGRPRWSSWRLVSKAAGMATTTTNPETMPDLSA